MIQFNDCPVEIQQRESEFMGLLPMVQELKPVRILEIGSLFGGTLWFWMKVCQPSGIVISVDGMVDPADNRWQQQRIGHDLTWHSWARASGVNLKVIETLSGCAIPQVSEVLAGEPLDFLFIDGDHSYGGVSSDWSHYSPLVRKGGLIAFHDLYGEPGVTRLWRHVKETHIETVEFIQDRNTLGIGVVRV